VISDTSLLNGKVVEATADNALATAAFAAIAAVRHFITGIIVAFSGATGVPVYKTLQIKFGTTVVANFDFDSTKEALVRIPLPSPIHGDYNQAVSVELGASGTGGVIGKVKLFGYSL